VPVAVLVRETQRCAAVGSHAEAHTHAKPCIYTGLKRAMWFLARFRQPLNSCKYPPAKPGALRCEPLKAAIRRRSRSAALLAVAMLVGGAAVRGGRLMPANVAATQQAAANRRIKFNRDIAPVFESKCVTRHGDAVQQSRLCHKGGSGCVVLSTPQSPSA